MPKIKTVRGIENSKVVPQKEWLVGRKKLLAKEKKFSKLRDELNLQRRKLPWVKIEKEYVFDGPNGKVTLGDLFCGKSQLLIYHFMFGPGWKEGCEHCSFWADHFDSVNIHVGQRDTDMSKPTTPSMPRWFGSARVKPLEVMPTTTAFASPTNSLQYSRSACAGWMLPAHVSLFV